MGIDISLIDQLDKVKQKVAYLVQSGYALMDKNGEAAEDVAAGFMQIGTEIGTDLETVIDHINVVTVKR